MGEYARTGQEVSGPPVYLAAADVRRGRASVEWLIGILPALERAALEADVVEVERLLRAAADDLSDLRGILAIRTG